MIVTLAPTVNIIIRNHAEYFDALATIITVKQHHSSTYRIICHVGAELKDIDIPLSDKTVTFNWETLLTSDYNIILQPGLLLMHPITYFESIKNFQFIDKIMDYKGKIKKENKFNTSVMLITRNETTLQVMRTIKTIEDNWEKFRYQYYSGKIEDRPSIELLVVTALSILNLPKEGHYSSNSSLLLPVVTIEPDDIPNIKLSDNWNDSLNFSVRTDKRLFIGTYQQKNHVMTKNKKLIERILNVENIL